MSRKKVLFLTSWYPSKENETLGNFVEKHAACASEVADVVVLYAVSSERVDTITIEEDNHKGYREVRVYYPKIQSRIPGFSAIQKLKAYKRALWNAFESIQVEFDLIHLNVAFPAGVFALELKDRLNIPYLILEHWTGYLSHTNEYSRSPLPIKRMHKKIFKSAEMSLAVSEHLGESLRSLGLIDDYSVYSNVVDNKLFYPTSTPNESNVIKIIHISSFNDQHKNVSGMLSAIGKLSRAFQLSLITETPAEVAKDFVEKAGIDSSKVSIESTLKPGLVADRIRKADVLILFSNYETFSVVLAESWMSGVPCIYSKCGGLTELNDPRLGIQIEKGNEEMLLHELEKFDRSEYDPEIISSFASRFEKRQLSDEIMKIYDQIC